MNLKYAEMAYNAWREDHAIEPNNLENNATHRAAFCEGVRFAMRAMKRGAQIKGEEKLESYFERGAQVP